MEEILASIRRIIAEDAPDAPSEQTISGADNPPKKPSLFKRLASDLERAAANERAVAESPKAERKLQDVAVTPPSKLDDRPDAHRLRDNSSGEDIVRKPEEYAPEPRTPVFRTGRLVFISHATADTERAQAIVAAFEAGGLKCWIAPRDVQPGSNFNAEIVRAIDRSSDMIFLFSEHSNASRHVKREINLWLDQDKPIIPIRLDGTKESDELRYLLAGMQWASVSDATALLKLFN